MSEPTTVRDLPFFGYGADMVAFGLETRKILRKELGYDPDCGTIACPAQRAGYEPEKCDDSNPTANLYDRIIKARVKNDDVTRIDGDNVITEADAKRAWLDAIAFFHAAREEAFAIDSYTYDIHHPDQKPSTAILDAAYTVARRLGWDEDDDTPDDLRDIEPNVVSECESLIDR